MFVKEICTVMTDLRVDITVSFLTLKTICQQWFCSSLEVLKLFFFSFFVVGLFKFTQLLFTSAKHFLLFILICFLRFLHLLTIYYRIKSRHSEKSLHCFHERKLFPGQNETAMPSTISHALDSSIPKVLPLTGGFY